jgi:uncharacterized protein YcfJ
LYNLSNTLQSITAFFEKQKKLRVPKMTRSRIGLFLSISLIILVDVSAGQQAVAQSKSMRCDDYARDYAKRNASGGMLQGAATGAAAGALIGGIFGSAGKGAGAGAAFGALSGGNRREQNKSELYDRAYNDCMRNSNNRN